MMDRRGLMTGAASLALLSDYAFAAGGSDREVMAPETTAPVGKVDPVGGVMARHYLYTGSHRVHYRRHGAGGAVVMLADFPNSSIYLDRLAAQFASDCAVIALDLPGTGESTPLAVERPMIADYADWLEEVVAALGLSRFDIVAFGTSAPLAMAFARRRPERVVRTVVVEPPVLDADEKAARMECAGEPLVPDLEGSHVTKHWGRLRDSYIFDPWFDRSMETRMERDLPSPERLYSEFLDVIRAGAGYADGMRAAWQDDPWADASQLPGLCVLGSAGTKTRLSGQVIEVRPIAAQDDFATIAQHLQALSVGNGAGVAPPAPPVEPVRDEVRRDYVNTSIGQVLLRRTAARKPATALPLFLFHGSLWSSIGLEVKLLAYSDEREVLCFDMPGVGDSPALGGAPEMVEFAKIIVEAIEALGFEAIDLEGGHSGAMAAIDVAVLMPRTVRHVILNGVTMFTQEELDEMLPHYLRPLQITDDGAFLNWSWQFLRDMYLWYPWYEHRWGKARSDARVPGADKQHASFVDFLKGGRSFKEYYNAALTFATAKRVPLMQAKVLFCCEKDDTLLTETVAAAELLPAATFVFLPDRSTDEGRARTEGLYFDFLADRPVS